MRPEFRRAVDRRAAGGPRFGARCAGAPLVGEGHGLATAASCKIEILRTCQNRHRSGAAHSGKARSRCPGLTSVGEYHFSGAARAGSSRHGANGSRCRDGVAVGIMVNVDRCANCDHRFVTTHCAISNASIDPAWLFKAVGQMKEPGWSREVRCMSSISYTLPRNTAAETASHGIDRSDAATSLLRAPATHASQSGRCNRTCLRVTSSTGRCKWLASRSISV